jgi:hypothetical protein
MAILRSSNDKTPGIRTFQIQRTAASSWHTVKYIRRDKFKSRFLKHRWMCACPDFMHRHMHANTHCAHIKRIRAFAQHLGGVSAIPRGVTVEIPDTVPAAPVPKLVIARK